jgi:hypothetical protein
MLDANAGWIFRHGPDGVIRRMCWLPRDRRHKGKIAFFGDRVCVGAATGVVTILDFSEVKY